MVSAGITEQRVKAAQEQQQQKKRASEMKGNRNKATSRFNSQLAFQRHLGVDSLPERGAAVVQRRHFGVDQTAAGMPLQRAGFPFLGG